MRDKAYTIVVPTTQIVERTILIEQEDFNYINHLKSIKKVEVSFVGIAANSDRLNPQTVEIVNEDYDLLMSADTMFAAGKEVGFFREQDVWVMVDLINDKVNSGGA